MNKRLLTIAAIAAGIALSGCSGDSKDKDESEVITPPSIDTELVENLSHVFNVDPQVMGSICSDDNFICIYDEQASYAEIGLKNFISLDYNLDTDESALKEEIEFSYASLSTKPISDFIIERPTKVLHRFTFQCKEGTPCGTQPNNGFQSIEKWAQVDKTEKTSDRITVYSLFSLKANNYSEILPDLVDVDESAELVTTSESISGQAWSDNTPCNNPDFDNPDNECTDRWSWTTLTTYQHELDSVNFKHFVEIVEQENQRQYTGE
ncbi:hypothetical protein MW334_003536 [Vibrio parahaemolyticus]|nr:hypothetical protein [Vibrio parahaemolyticus]EJB8408349.1 hypothetical protein [Vibrio parahaemolyticus]ELA9712811.1 hypothetical protein [Vibrio parahaemolyticus]ELA9726319.1 hypothetical protein [Vibrio parahaemolyticus]